MTRHEPWSALDGGKGTGSTMLLDICKAAVGMMQRGGFIALETGGASPLLDNWKAACKAQVKEELPEGLQYFTASAAMLSHTREARSQDFLHNSRLVPTFGVPCRRWTSRGGGRFYVRTL